MLAFGCWLNLLGVPAPLISDSETLIGVFVLEFLIIHGFVFFVFVRASHGTGKLKWFARGFVACLIAMYGLIAWSSAGGV